MVISAVTTGKQEINVSTATSDPHLQQKIYYNTKIFGLKKIYYKIKRLKNIFNRKKYILQHKKIFNQKKYLDDGDEECVGAGGGVLRAGGRRTAAGAPTNS